jgi:hypothetical protein
MKIVIPSHKRYQMIQDKTLKLLNKHNFSKSDIYIFVSPLSLKEYEPLKEQGYNLVESKNTILDTRNHIINYFDEGEMIVEMDDDVEDIYNTIKGQKETPVEDLKDLFLSNFKMLGSDGLWGINASHNSFFGSGKDQWGCRTIINSCLGYYNNKNIKLTVTEKEDYERVLQFDNLHLPILKRGAYGTKTKYWKNKGGIQDYCSFEERVKRQYDSAVKLLENYGTDRCYMVMRKNGLADIRFKR